MDDVATLSRLGAELREEVLSNLLPYWISEARDEEGGGYYGRILQCDGPVVEADKGSVLNARILWTFSAAYRHEHDQQHLEAARRAYDYFNQRFWDAEHEGIFWTVDCRGNPNGLHKQTYAQAFAIYGLAEFHRATGDGEALHRAIGLFHLIESHCYDAVGGGYWEAFDRQWEPLADMRLSDKDINAPKNVNTHLHVLEAYATLYAAWPDPLLRQRLAELIRMFLAKPFLDRATFHLTPFFEADFKVASNFVSYGHDIEASWLVQEAALAIGDPELTGAAARTAVEIARVTLDEGQDADGGIRYESFADGSLDGDRHWWVQAEAIVGFVNAYQESGDTKYLDAAVRVWDFTKQHLIDNEKGGWLGRVSCNGQLYTNEDKVGLWKCPYHNVRACLEVMARSAVSAGTQGIEQQR